MADSNHVSQGTQSLEHSLAVPEPSKDVLDVQGLAALTHIPKATILTLRSRAPDKLPPPFRTHPLLWRTRTVVTWMEKQEQQEMERIARSHRRA